MNQLIQFPSSQADHPEHGDCIETNDVFKQLTDDEKVFPLLMKYHLFKSDGRLDPIAIEKQFREFVDIYYLDLEKGVVHVLFKSVFTPVKRLKRFMSHPDSLLRGLRKTCRLSDLQILAYAELVREIGQSDRRYRNAARFLHEWANLFYFDATGTVDWRKNTRFGTHN